MKEQIRQAVEDVWRHDCAALEDALDESIGELKSLLRLDEYQRHRHDPDHLERALGPLAATNLDLGSLSQVLGESTHSRVVAPERLKRVQELIETLGDMKEAWSNTPPDLALVEIDKDENEIRALAEEHLDRVAGVFRSLRIAQLEGGAQYEAETLDPFFADFGGRRPQPGKAAPEHHHQRATTLSGMD